ncbi:protein of unknown function [Myroides marinus]|uniref:Branched-chain amino acid aminotransferase n=1 Tax=Myroides marinus TaxID=703342 RepID=A0A1H6WX10_9FLAO|nr:DUF4920 domain-containing protein [Myroides marinus]KUF42186.1 branched-chain amino acid aminotransferase [Myroides marinus]MDM1361091.1 DUF4920 domain-containing protein [Myroides marinus]MDM1367078.1 DUF4920 domain-containing protein [Myroides marinus]MDM1376992.1 DUF4920 domain-containing protein [Myroides marinus]MDM1404196.1 DUF4920 domain-containing protein [Myroides marinus]
MNRIVACLSVVALVFMGCKDQEKKEETAVVELVKSYDYFGDSIVMKDVLSKEAMLEKYQNLKEGDTIKVQFETTINEVCQKKGCWMNVELPGEKKGFVRFTNYGFFAPMNAAGHEVVVDGKAFVSVVSVDELKHYAKDAGKSEEEIAAITEPKITYAFTADGIAINKDKQ